MHSGITRGVMKTTHARVPLLETLTQRTCAAAGASGFSKAPSVIPTYSPSENQHFKGFFKGWTIDCQHPKASGVFAKNADSGL